MPTLAEKSNDNVVVVKVIANPITGKISSSFLSKIRDAASKFACDNNNSSNATALVVPIEFPFGTDVGVGVLCALSSVIGAASHGGGPFINVLPKVVFSVDESSSPTQIVETKGDDGQPSEQIVYSAAKVPDGCTLPQNHVAVGGTFDRLHAGHRLLLASAVVCTRSKLYVGITGDSLLVKKSNHHLLQSFAERRDAVLKYITQLAPELMVNVSELLAGQQPLAGTLECMNAIVVSAETEGPCDSINKHRKNLGFDSIYIVVCDLIGAATTASDTAGGKFQLGPTAWPKLSSSHLRALHASSNGNQS